MQTSANLQPPGKYFTLQLTITDVSEDDIRAAVADDDCNAILVKQLGVQAEQAIRRALSASNILETALGDFDG